MHIEKGKHHNQADLKKYFQTYKVKPPVKKLLEFTVQENKLKVLKDKKQVKFAKNDKRAPGSTD